MQAEVILNSNFGISNFVPAQIGRNVLHYTASQGHLSAMKSLVQDYKLDPDAKDKVSTACLFLFCVF